MTQSHAKKQIFDYFLVLDFEATCDRPHQPEPQEIIEFPVMKLNASSLKIESTFHTYVKPEVHPELTTFCTELTGIIQEMVDDKPTLPQVLQDFDHWMNAEGLLKDDVRFAFATFGDWDLKTMLPSQCQYLDIKPKDYFNSGQWINVKRSVSDVTAIFPRHLLHALSTLKLQHIGRHHSGIDDCKNISALVVELIKRGQVLDFNNRSNIYNNRQRNRQHVMPNKSS
ncbi:hypothetical protein LOTGIDRAFT_126582 [Lottia gigantea]|uniref:Exonuclease domain-containing protein n=1 Tax=Lottia gigantea TaxID=225164 RepID=V3ZAW5_LOTGI|nr:hypothetical protein LOTGIDRAFT_126582 [Lottia gigantea]ESO88133.1 hypothetical protein LOTGIDRAFT_126582 [Lottia gigantea]